MDKKMKFQYPSSITDIVSVNESFDSCVIRICYHGPNRNHSFISKDTIERALPTLAYCPIVVNYNIEEDSIGGHDSKIVRRDDGTVKMVNVTDAVGVIPANPEYYWEVVDDESGSHEYLCTPAILWKRTPVYEKLKTDGIESQSMEINVKNGHKAENYYQIDDFCFTAFCILGDNVSPCFESACIETFALSRFEQQYNAMFADFRREFSTVITASADDTHTQSCSKGGTCELDVNELMTKYSLSAEDINFDTTDMPIEEIERKFAEIKAAKDGTTAFEDGETGEEATGNDGTDGATDDGEVETDPENGSDETDTPTEDEHQDDDDDPAKKKQDYSLTASQFMSELYDALDAVRYNDPYWGDMCKYCFMDYDAALNEVYVIDMEDFKLYGMPFSMNGDKVVVDFAQCKRKKTCYVDFDEGEAAFAENKAFANLIPKLHEKFKALDEELKTLRTFKEKIDEQARKDEANGVFAKFSDLEGNADFKALQENYGDMSASQIEEKCFAIRGRNMPTNFSLDSQTKPIRLPIEAQARKDADEPYGGIFARYGIGNR